MSKNLFLQKFLKIYLTKSLKKKKNQAKLDRTKNFPYLLLHNCRPQLSKIISGEKTGHSAVSPLYFEILLIFPNLLRSKVTVFWLRDIKSCFTCGDSNLH